MYIFNFICIIYLKKKEKKVSRIGIEPMTPGYEAGALPLS